jgi:hypothetical protein
MRSADALARLLVTKMSDIRFYSGEVSNNEIIKHDGIKSHILEDPFSVVSILSDDSFKVDTMPSDISLAVLRDYHHGFQRVNQQWLSVKELSKNDDHVAWTVVSVYYCAFFCAVEILRLQGKFLMSLTTDESNILFKAATGSQKEKFLSKGHTNFVGSISHDFLSIEFKSSGAKPHKFAWSQLAHSTFGALPNRTSDWIELDRFKKICKGTTTWEQPSDIRNRWNYRDAVFFGPRGKGYAYPFLKILKGKDSATAWVTDHCKVSSENDAIASLAVICQFLWGALEQSYSLGFSQLFPDVEA